MGIAALRPSYALEMIWGARKGKYFCKEDWADGIRLIRFNKCGRAGTLRSPDGAQRNPGSQFQNLGSQLPLDLDAIFKIRVSRPLDGDSLCVWMAYNATRPGT